MNPVILYHGNCTDGTGAALAAFMRFGMSAGYIAVNYGQPLPDGLDGHDLFILDFSYPRDALEKLHRSAKSLIVLDHHATAQKDLEGLEYARFDMDKSGAVLAWEYFFPNKPVPEFFLYLQDRDLWKFELPLSREVSMALRSYPFNYEDWVNLYEDVGRLKSEGVSCRRLTEQQVETMAKNMRIGFFDLRDDAAIYFDRGESGTANTYNVPVANATVFFSEVGERLLQLFPDAPFSAYYLDRADGKRQWGLRSRKDFDCSVVAKAFGGGGHKQASGFIQNL